MTKEKETTENGRRKLTTPIAYTDKYEAKKVDGKPTRPIAYTDEEGKIIKDPSEKKYLILFEGWDEKGDELNFWKIMTGQKETREFIIGMIESIDVYESKILVDDVEIEDMEKDLLTIYDFLKIMEKHYIDGFDVEPYAKYTKSGGFPVE